MKLLSTSVDEILIDVRRWSWYRRLCTFSRVDESDWKSRNPSEKWRSSEGPIDFLRKPFSFVFRVATSEDWLRRKCFRRLVFVVATFQLKTMSSWECWRKTLGRQLKFLRHKIRFRFQNILQKIFHFQRTAIAVEVCVSPKMRIQKSFWRNRILMFAFGFCSVGFELQRFLNVRL